MSYLGLARKYRPRTFAEVVGQDVVTAVLRGAIAEQRIGHAYLFSGPRGTGKTTTARILAKALNCEQGPTPDPCGQCERCLSCDAGTELDIIEIDAASNRGIESVRGLREQVAYVPMRARFKIFIVDEVHMLTKEAFNAFLKTLEEPPPHVKFLFATTELHKVIDTVVSRCQVLRLQPISEPIIAARLTTVFAEEGIRPAPGVTAELAHRARGGMRDALSLADQLLALVGDAPTLDDLLRLEGGVEVENLLERLEAGDRAGALRSLPLRKGVEEEVLAALLDHLRLALLVAVCGPESPEVQAVARAERIVARAGRIGAERLQAWLEELLLARDRLRLLPSEARLVLELAVLELCRLELGLPLAELTARLERLEGRLAERAEGRTSRTEPRASKPAVAPTLTPSVPPAESAAAAPAAPRPAQPAVITPAQPTVTAAAQPATPPRSLQETWLRLIDTLTATHDGLADVLRRCGRLADLGERRAAIQLAGLRAADRRITGSPRNQSALTEALAKVTGRKLEVVLDDAASTPPADEFTEAVKTLFDARLEERR